MSPTICVNFFPASYTASPNHDLYKLYFKAELDLRRLHDISSYLPLAGFHENPEPLHLQKLKCREIFITEQIDLHMVYHWNQLYIKPLPVWLLKPSVWEDHLCNSDNFPAAIGFLLSYTHLIRYESDYRIAKEKSLLPEGLSWKAWVQLANELRNNEATTHERFRYGLLSLGRLNLICRCVNFSLITGYLPFLNVNFAEYLQHNFGYLLTVFVYMTMVLSAMQVGLATKQLQNQHIFMQIAAGFAIFSIVLPFCVLLGIMLAAIGCCLTILWGACCTKLQSVTPSPKLSSLHHKILSCFGRNKASLTQRNGSSV